MRGVLFSPPSRGGLLVTCVVPKGRPWRPHVDDVERISRGLAARVRGTGSREIPHRLNAEERDSFLMAQRKVCHSSSSQVRLVGNSRYVMCKY